MLACQPAAASLAMDALNGPDLGKYGPPGAAGSMISPRSAYGIVGRLLTPTFPGADDGSKCGIGDSVALASIAVLGA